MEPCRRPGGFDSVESVRTDGARVYPEDHPQQPSTTHRAHPLPRDSIGVHLRPLTHPGGMPAGSRWSSEATPPEPAPLEAPHPGRGASTSPCAPHKARNPPHRSPISSTRPHLHPHCSDGSAPVREASRCVKGISGRMPLPRRISSSHPRGSFPDHRSRYRVNLTSPRDPKTCFGHRRRSRSQPRRSFHQRPRSKRDHRTR